MMFILLCMISLVLGEPPARSSNVEAAQLSYVRAARRNYLPPDPSVSSASTPFDSLSNQYLPPSAREVSTEYGTPESREHVSQNYGLPARDTLTFRSGISSNYGAPLARSSQYDTPYSDLIQRFATDNSKKDSNSYSAPSFRNFLSNLYGAPQKSSPLSQYGAPDFRTSNDYKQQISSYRKYGVPGYHSTRSHSRSTAQEYGTPSNSHLSKSRSNSLSFRSQKPHYQDLRDSSQTDRYPSHTLSTQYGIPSARNSDHSLGKSANSLLPSTFVVPKGKTNNQEDGAFEASNLASPDLTTNAYASSYSSTRSPSLEYGVPSTRDTMPSQEYGVPQHSLAVQGYEYTRNALERDNQEPANYEFAYQVSDDQTGSDFGHRENRQLDRVEGTYFVLLPDGTKQVVEYEADEDGFKPRISVEAADLASAFTAEGPY